MTTHDGATPPAARRTAVRDGEDAVVARLQQLAADLDDAPDPRFRAATRDRLVAMAAVRTPQPAPRSGLRRLLAPRADGGPPPAWRTRLTAGLAGAAIAVTALGTLAALSADARPGDALYGVKRGTEQTQLALAGDDRGLTLLEFAGTRLDELAALTDPGAADVRDLLGTMEAQTREATALLTAQAVAGRDAALVDELADWAGRQGAELAALRPGLPEGAAAASLDVLADVTDRATGVLTALGCAAGPATAGTDELGPVPVACPSEVPATGTPTDEAPPSDTDVPSDDEPSSEDVDDPAGTAPPAPQPGPAPAAPTAGSGTGGDRGSPPASRSDGGTAPVPPPAPDTPPVGERPPPRPELPRPAPVVPAAPSAPVLDLPLVDTCIGRLVC
ncbi:DUF5667 domain-containing protein [Geodermatophilus sp. SYSU D01176]